MDLYDIAIARKLAGGSGGGGGSSDFSTAEVTIANSSGNPFVGFGCQFDDEYDIAFATIYSEGNGVISLILYKGSSQIELHNSINKNVVALSGDVEGLTDVLQPNTYIGFIVTGDCTITIS